MLVYIVAFVLGIAISAVWAWYIREVAGENAVLAAVSDIGVLVLTFAQYQLWAWQHNDWRVFAAIIAGNIPGTYFYVRWKNVQRGGNVAVSRRDCGERSQTSSPDRRAEAAAARHDVRSRADTVSADGDLRSGDQSTVLRRSQNPPCS